MHLSELKSCPTNSESYRYIINTKLVFCIVKRSLYYRLLAGLLLEMYLKIVLRGQGQAIQLLTRKRLICSVTTVESWLHNMAASVKRTNSLCRYERLILMWKNTHHFINLIENFAAALSIHVNSIHGPFMSCVIRLEDSLFIPSGEIHLSQQHLIGKQVTGY